MINEHQLVKWAGGTKDAAIAFKWFEEYFMDYEVFTMPRIAAFLAQLIHESCQFKYRREIASGKAYEGRKDLGNVHPGDGVRYKGRGYIQITGRNNYIWISKEIFGDPVYLLQHPEKLEIPQYAMQSAFIFWDSKNLNKYADMPHNTVIGTKHHGEMRPFKYITYRINGGFNGFAERVQVYNTICADLKLPLYR